MCKGDDVNIHMGVYLCVYVYVSKKERDKSERECVCVRVCVCVCVCVSCTYGYVDLVFFDLTSMVSLFRLLILERYHNRFIVGPISPTNL